MYTLVCFNRRLHLRLTGAICTDKPFDFARRQIEIDIVEGTRRPESLAQANSTEQ